MSAEALGLLPFGILVAGAAVLAIFDRAFPADERVARSLGAAIAAAAGASALIAGPGEDALDGALRRDASALFFVALVCLATAASLALDSVDPRARGAIRGSGPVTTLTAAAGATLLAASGDLLLMLVAVEIVFMALLGLVVNARSRDARRASRAFFLAGGTASALFAAGVGLSWSVSGTFSTGGLGATTAGLSVAGVALVLVGLCAFVALVPLHLWLAPVLDALPAPNALFVAVVPRVAAFAALLHCAGVITAGAASVDWRACLAVLAALTLAVGALAALTEVSLRRIVTYLSQVAMGQLAVAAAAGVGASAAIAFASAAFVVILVGVFAVLASLATDDATVDDLRGLARRRPLLAVALGALLLGLAGLPPTAGFIARLAIFESAVDAQLAWLMFVAAIATVLAATAAARVGFACLDAGAGAAVRSRTATVIAVIAAVLVVAGGVVPAPLLELARGVRF